MKEIWNSESLSHALKIHIEHKLSTGIIQFNSQDVTPGDLFIALKGENGDGHTYLLDAYNRGAAAAIASDHKLIKTLTPELQQKTILVHDTSQALHDLAMFKRKQSNATIIAITGSVGKTSTKEIIGAMHRKCSETFIGRGNFNNHLGLMLNLASMQNDANYAVFELGMSMPGEIAPLSKILRPHIVAITNINAVHLAAFNSLDDIALEKSDICAGAQGGTAILNADSPYYEILVDRAKQHGIKKIYSFAENTNSADIKLQKYDHNNGNPKMTYLLNHSEIIGVESSIQGRHQSLNIAIGLMISTLNNLPIEKVTTAITNLTPTQGRGNILQILYHDLNLTIINDCYNANPISMKASLENFKERDAINKIAILGDMLELEPIAQQMHQDLYSSVIQAHLNTLVTIGPLMQYLHNKIAQNCDNITLLHYSSVIECIEHIHQIITQDAMILVKASNGMKLNKIIEILVKSSE